jgi:RHS repeat-associated protein
MGNKFQDMSYTFDDVGNVKGYTNNAWGYTTSQNYRYDDLYQLVEVKGNNRSHPGGQGGNTEYTTNYAQQFDFSMIGNMTGKVSTQTVSNTNRIGADLNYNLDYAYYPGTHKAERIGSRYYDYDGNGNLVAEREGSHAANAGAYRPYYQEGDLYWTDYGFGVVRPEGAKKDDGVFQRNYQWNERNLLSESSDSVYSVQYRYGADGQRALKFTANSGRSTVYFNKMWQSSDVNADWLQSKHVYVGEDRIATKYNSEGNDNTQAEKERTYYYHSDHLGSAQVVTNWRGQVHERLEYTPYGELWIDWKGADAPPEDSTPFRFTGKEMDPETGLYYYGARYLDPKTSRWLSGDPATGDYVPSAPVNDEAKKRNGNLPGQGGIFNYVNLHVYHYAGNNPVKYVDPDGREIGYDENTDPQKLEAAINAYSYHQYKFNENGVLEKTDQVNKKGSEQYSEAIDTLIGRKETITIGLYDDSNITKDKNPDRGVDTTEQPLNVGDNFKIFVYSKNGEERTTGNGGTQVAPVGRKLMHEIAGHAAPFVKQQQGNAITIENNIMTEIFSKIMVYPQGQERQKAFDSYVKRKEEFHPSYR